MQKNLTPVFDSRRVPQNLCVPLTVSRDGEANRPRRPLTIVLMPRLRRDDEADRAEAGRPQALEAPISELIVTGLDRL